MLNFLTCEFEHEVTRKARDVATNSLLKCTCLDGIKLCQMKIQDNFLLAEKENAFFGLKSESVSGFRIKIAGRHAKIYHAKIFWIKNKFLTYA